MDYNEILVITLGVFLALFLLLGIILVVMIINIAGRIKKIVEKAEAMADKVEHAGDLFHKTAGPLALARIVTNIADSFKHKKSSK